MRVSLLSPAFPQMEVHDIALFALGHNHGLRIIGIERTGGHFNGILASSLALDCKPHGYVEHCLLDCQLNGRCLGKVF